MEVHNRTMVIDEISRKHANKGVIISIRASEAPFAGSQYSASENPCA